MSKFLDGKIAVVTGGASGMGLGIARVLAQAGARIAIGSRLRVDNRGSNPEGELAHLPRESDLEQAAVTLSEFGVKVYAAYLDVTLAASVEGFLSEASNELGRSPDILVNAAGITAEQHMVGHSEELWQRVMEVNSTGTFRTIKHCLPDMMERGWGRIINIASTAASVGAPSSAAYCASKAAVAALSRCVALEGATKGVTCNSISPGWVDTSFGKKWINSLAEDEGRSDHAAYFEEVKAQNPQGRLIQVDEVAELALYLCRENAQGMTMQDLTLSAGSLW